MLSIVIAVNCLFVLLFNYFNGYILVQVNSKSVKFLKVANVFLGFDISPMTIRPYLEKMSRSEIFAFIITIWIIRSSQVKFNDRIRFILFRM